MMTSRVQIPDDYDDDGLSSVSSSSAASSSFSSSAGRFSDVDYRDRPWQSEVEEIPSFRWLTALSPAPPSFRSLTSPSPVPEPSDVDRGHLVYAQGKPSKVQMAIQLADQVAKQAGDVHSSYMVDCADLKAKTLRLVALLRQAARADLYERPTLWIMYDTLQVLEKTQALVAKCSAHGLLKRVFTINPAAAFKKMSAQLDNSIGDVSWLLRVSATRRHGGDGDDDDDDDDGYLRLPLITSNEPILCRIWEQVSKLHNGSSDDRDEAAASLVYVAAAAIGLQGRDPESVDRMLAAFAKVLKEGPMKAQARVAWAVSELAGYYPKCQDFFAQPQNNVIRLLVGHLAFETVQEHSKYTIPPTKVGHMSIHSVVLANASAGNSNSGVGVKHPRGNAAADDRQPQIRNPLGNHGHANKDQMHAVIQSTMGKSAKPQCPSNGGSNTAGNGSISKQLYHNSQQQYFSPGGPNLKGREAEDPATKAYMKAMAAKALWQLARGNAAICKIITNSKALLCFAVLLEKGPDEVKYNSAMALMEISRMAEKDADLRRSAFKPNSPAAKAVVDQVLRVVEKAVSDDLLQPCITALGCLSRTFRATDQMRIIGPLVRLLDEQEEDHITREVVIALTKFACDENFLHLDHSKAIIAAGGPKHLVQLVYFGEQPVLQIEALVLLCYIAHHVPDDEALAQAEALTVLEWASKQSFMVHDPAVEQLLAKAKGKCNSSSTSPEVPAGSPDRHRRGIRRGGSPEKMMS